ncbi:venom allergen 3-like [Scaptodrosophila lebanonensis]|uniref:Venom allergen 3-like n=1 Tax=Drosophila lebanonensis TaxID=7225 RepID=A0A6J2TBP0_DROLE|nr:venom allergen 3-like [Scaptodrosophila lebanonensis]
MKHIACKHNGELGKACPISTQLINISGHQALILHEHNTLRNTLASGKLFDLPPPERMATMQWSDELAMLAELNVKQCQMVYDPCHNTYQFRNSGQNLAIHNMTMPVDTTRMTDDLLIKESITKWWDQYENLTAARLEHFPKDKAVQEGLRNFAVMARDSNTHVGCAAIRFDRENVQQFLLACDYSANYAVDKPLYRLKNVGCQNGYDKVFTALCKEGEQYRDVEPLETTSKKPAK